jgi:hypothetical protein
MDKTYFVVFKKQEGEITNSYSIVDSKTLLTIPSAIIYGKKEIENKMYLKGELEAMRDELLK